MGPILLLFHDQSKFNSEISIRPILLLFHDQSKFNSEISITKICLYNFDPFKPHFYIVILGFTGVCIIFSICAQKHRIWVLVRTAFAEAVLTSTHNLCFEQKYEKYQSFFIWKFSVFGDEIFYIFELACFVMVSSLQQTVTTVQVIHKMISGKR